MDGYVYRIYTEDKDNLPEIARLADDWGFPGFTVIHTDGCWIGKQEKSLIIEIVIQASCDPFADYQKIKALAWDIGILGQQEEVLTTMQECTRIDFLAINS